MKIGEPYISFVVTARNDDHGGNLLRRMQIFVTGLMEQAKKHNLSAELILVEWNPPPDRPRLFQALSWPEGPCRVRIIEVPYEIHRRFRHSDKLALFQMIAKNVGIRRAEGRFILATNIDLLFSDRLMSFLASRSLKPQFMYRVDRYDVPDDVPTDVTIEEQLGYCQHNFIRVHMREGSFRKDALHWIWLRKTSARFAPLYRYLLGSMLRLSRVRRPRVRWPRFGLFTIERNSAGTMLKLMIPRVKLKPIIKRMRASMLKAVLRIGNEIRRVKFLRYIFSRPYPLLHTNGCGDFTLIAREHWHALRGYPELEMFSFNLDSVLLHMAYQNGVRERIFRDPMRIYHIEHSSGWTPEGDRKMKERLRTMGIPMLDFPQFESWAIRMQKEKRPIILNGEGWGLASDHLPETVVE